MSEIDLDAVRDAIGTVRLWAPVSATKDIHWFARDLADRAEALLARIAELEAQLERATNAWADAKIRGSRLAATVRNALDAVKENADG